MYFLCISLEYPVKKNLRPKIPGSSLAYQSGFSGLGRGAIKKEGNSNLESIGHHNRKIRTQERAHSTLFALFHILALGGKIPSGVHLVGGLENFGRAKFDADPATLTIPLFYVKLGHIDSISENHKA